MQQKKNPVPVIWISIFIVKLSLNQIWRVKNRIFFLEKFSGNFTGFEKWLALYFGLCCTVRV